MNDGVDEAMRTLRESLIDSNILFPWDVARSIQRLIEAMMTGPMRWVWLPMCPEHGQVGAPLKAKPSRRQCSQCGEVLHYIHVMREDT